MIMVKYKPKRESPRHLITNKQTVQVGHVYGEKKTQVTLSGGDKEININLKAFGLAKR